MGHEPGRIGQKTLAPGDFPHQPQAALVVAETGKDVGVQLVAEAAVFDFGVRF